MMMVIEAVVIMKTMMMMVMVEIPVSIGQISGFLQEQLGERGGGCLLAADDVSF